MQNICNKATGKIALIVMMLMLLVSVILMSTLLTSADSYYTIRINYYYKDGSPAHDPYVSTIPSSEAADINITVKNPKIDGFVPMTAAAGGLSEETTTFTYTESDPLTSSVTKNIYYVAGLTHYRVIYYKQNIYDDLYSRDNTVAAAYTDRYGYTGSNPTEIEEENLFPGFKNLFHEPDAIAADGSTVFKVYYDRNYYSIAFDLGDGGYGVEPVYAKYQTLYHIGEPQRMGYRFIGWARTSADSSDGEEGKDWYYIPADTDTTVEGFDPGKVSLTESEVLANPITGFTQGTMPCENRYYKALWEETSTKYSVVYWIENTDSSITDTTFDGKTEEEIQEIIADNYSVAATYEVSGVVSGTELTYSDIVGSYDMLDSTGYDNLSSALESKFPSMSSALRTELSTYTRYFERNDRGEAAFDAAGGTIAVAGNGTTRINVYYDRKEFTLQFFYAKTTGGTVTVDDQGVPRWNKGSNGHISLTNGTKQFSNKTSATELYQQLNDKLFSREVTDDLPQIVNHTDLISQKYLDNGSGTPKFWYYEVKANFGASLIGKWFNDAFDTPLRKDRPSGDTTQKVYFGSWAVEKGSDYFDFEDDVRDRGNYTIKGVFERLYDEILLKESHITKKLSSNPSFNYTELHFVASWDNTGSLTTNGWNDGVKRVFNFTYKNCVELLPSEDYVASLDGGIDILINGGTYPAGDHVELNAAGESETVHYDSRTIEGRYTKIIEMDVGGGVIKRFGLTELNTIETYDAGDQYTNNDGTQLLEAKTLGSNVRKNQTAVTLMGFDAYDSLSSTIKTTFTVYGMSDGVLTPQTVNTCYGTSNSNYGNGNAQATFYAANGFDRYHHADIYFFYTRQKYNLNYQNFANLDNTYTAYYNAPLFLNKFAYTPTYPYPDLVNYYSFVGWYYDPFYVQQVDFANDRMIAGDVTMYAKWVPKVINVSFYPTYNDYYDQKNRISCILNPDYDEDDHESQQWLDGDIPVEYGKYISSVNIPADIVEREEAKKEAAKAAEKSAEKAAKTRSAEILRPDLEPPAEGAMFAGWYYLRDNKPVRFEPENIPVTALNEAASADPGALRLFAEWVTKDVGRYQIRYVEQGTDIEVADPEEGRSFVEKTRTFDAKAGSELNTDHAWIEGGQNWWPTINSHSITIKKNTQGEIYKPNTFTFEYFQKNGVYYKVKYLDATNRTPLKVPELDNATEKTDYSLYASIKEDAPFIPGYVAKDASLSLVLTASTLDTEEAQEAEELENNVLIFYYNKNESDYLYEVEYYKQNVDDDDYSLYHRESLTVPIAADPDPTTIDIADLYERQYSKLFEDNGCSRVLGGTKVVVGSAAPVSVADDATITITGEVKTTVRIYFSRNTYAYSVQYVDYRAERDYNKAVEDGEDVSEMWNGVMETIAPVTPEKVEKVVTISDPESPSSPFGPTEYNYTGTDTPYIRVDSKKITLTIAPVTDGDPDVNLVKIYYKKHTERDLRYRLVCVNESSPYTDVDYINGIPAFGGLSRTGQTVDSYEEIQPVRFYSYNEATNPGASESTPAVERYVHQHKYRFLGWYDNPNAEGTPLKAAPTVAENDPDFGAQATLNASDLGLDEKLPTTDVTYYACVEQVMITADFEFRLVEDDLPIGTGDGETAEDRAAAAIVAAAPTDDGSKTGGYFDFSIPSTYVNGDPVPWSRSEGFNVEIDNLPGDTRLYKYEFAEWWEEDLSTGNLIRKKVWNDGGGWSPTILENQLTRNSDKHIIAVYKRRDLTELPYTIEYNFKTRKNEDKSFVVTGTLTGDELDETSPSCCINDSDVYELTNEFIMLNAPYESNYGQQLLWTDADDRIFKTSETDPAHITTTVSAKQDIKTVYAHYRLDPTVDEYTTISTAYGANYVLDKSMVAIDVTGDTVDGKYFTYWQVRKTKTGPVIAKCYDAKFSLCMMDSYWISPVFANDNEDDKAVTLVPDKLATGGEKWRAWTWSNESDGVELTPSVDLVFSGVKSNIIFARIDGTKDGLGADWTNVWNKTDDLTVGDGRVFTLTNWKGTWNETMDGTWSNIVLTHLDYTRNRWTDADDKDPTKGNTDQLYTDFEIAFENAGTNLRDDSDRKTGVVFELCANLPASATFTQGKDYGFVSNEANLKAAIKSKSTVYYYTDGKRRSMQVVEIPTSSLTKKNRVEFGKPYKNNYKVVDGEKNYINSRYVLKATAYLIEGDDVTLSNSVYICLSNIAAKNMAISIPGMTEITP